MGDKKFIFLFLCAAVFLFSGLLYAQESLPVTQPGYYVDKSAGEPVFKQRLVWDKEEYALYYEVTIQTFSGQYRDYRIEKTGNAFIEISLPPGRYRYNVTPYDLLERRCDSSDWEEFIINTAFQPEINKVSPGFFYMDQNHDRVLLISGNNIFNDSVIYLRNGRNELVPVNKVVTNNTSVRLTFDDDKLIPGTYEIYIKNPGGLDAVFGGFFIGYHSRVETFVKVGYQPAIPSSGEMEKLFGSYLYPQGITFRLESLSSERASFKAGMELELSFYNFNFNDSIKPKEDYNFPNVRASFVDYGVNISMQSRFNHLRNAITFSFGFGLTSFESSGYDIDDYGSYIYYDRDELNAHMSLGLSGLFLVHRFFYIETGVDLTYYFTGFSVLIKPKVGLVLKI